jgi:MFS family permease
MREIADLLRHEPRSRIFFLTLTQSALGTGAGYVVLLILAYERYESPWAVSLTLAAGLVPAMLLGPIFGAAADRWSRRGCLVVADLLRAGAFAGIALVDSFAAMVAFAALAGIGTALFTPAALAALPSIVDDERRAPASTSLYGAIDDLGFTLGPALAAGLLLIGGPETAMLINVVTFAISAALLSSLRFGDRPARAVGLAQPSLLREARDGMRATIGMRAIRVVVFGSSAALFCGGLFNVAELLFARGEIGTSDSGFSILVALFGLGFICGSLAGSRGGELPLLKRRYLTGVLVMAAGFLLSGLAPSFALALLTFALAGFGNGLVLVYERLLIQRAVPDALLGRVFGVNDAFASWAFAIAFLAAGGFLSAFDSPRATMAIAGGIGIAVWAISLLALRGEWLDDEGRSGGSADALDAGVLGEDDADVVDGRARVEQLEALDDVGEGEDDPGIELGPRMGR